MLYRARELHVTGKLPNLFHKAESRVGKVTLKAPVNYAGTIISIFY